MLTVTNLTAGYGDTPVLKDISFQLDRGFCVLLGQNGSGKTTLFRAVSGSLRPVSGRVTLDGKDLLCLTVRQRARLLAQVLSTHQTAMGLTGRQLAEMAFYAANGIFYQPGEKERKKILHTAQEIGALQLLDCLLEKMSSGERQLTELMAALCQDTPVLLLDEPTAALDFNRTHEFLSKAKQMSEEKTVLATLHDPALALCYADRVLLLKDGGIAADFVPAHTEAQTTQRLLRLLYPGVQVITAQGKQTVIC